MSKDYGFGRHELKQVIDEIALKRTIYKELLLVINYRSGSDEQWETGNVSACRMSILWDKIPKKYKVE